MLKDIGSIRGVRDIYPIRVNRINSVKGSNRNVIAAPKQQKLFKKLLNFWSCVHQKSVLVLQNGPTIEVLMGRRSSSQDCVTTGNQSANCTPQPRPLGLPLNPLERGSVLTNSTMRRC